MVQFPLDARLKDGTGVRLILADRHDHDALAALYERIVAEGTSYPHDRMPAPEAFEEYWFRAKTTVVAYPGGAERRAPLLGAFYLKANWPGRARHVANAGFIVSPEWRNKGLGWLLGAVMLDYAADLGFRSVLFNLVFAENYVARHLWKKLGFEELAVIPGAVRNDAGSYQDAVIMWRLLRSSNSAVGDSRKTGTTNGRTE